VTLSQAAPGIATAPSAIGTGTRCVAAIG
jgi:hypothetical protein